VKVFSSFSDLSTGKQEGITPREIENFCLERETGGEDVLVVFEFVREKLERKKFPMVFLFPST
jgi:hypothetical protein